MTNTKHVEPNATQDVQGVGCVKRVDMPDGYYLQDEDKQGWTWYENRVPLDKPLDYISRQAAIDETQNGMDLDRIKSIGVYVPNNVEGNKPMESYILRNAAINEIYHHFPSLSHTEAAMVLHTVPSADVAEVVRCRDCARYDTHDKRCRYWNHGIGVDLDGFCSKGVRTDER